MLKKNKALIMVVISVLIVSMFAFVGCAKKGTIGEEYDSTGLPLTKAAALKLWQGEWRYENRENNLSEITYRNDRNNNKYLIFGNIMDINMGKNLDHYENQYSEAEVRYNSKTRTLYFKRIFDTVTITDSIHFVDKNTLLAEDNVGAGHLVWIRA